MSRIRAASLGAVFGALLLLAVGCAAGEDPLAEGAGTEPATADGTEGGDGASPPAEGDPGAVVIGSTNFTEQLILANMYADVLESEGVEVSTRLNLGNREVVFPALRSGEIDLLPEYTGAVVAFLAPEEGEVAGQSPETVYQRLQELLPEELVALQPSDAQDADALAVTQEFAEETGVETVSDLAALDRTIRIGGPPELETRYQGLPGLAEVYGLDNVEFVSLDAGGPLTLGALESGQIDAGRVFTTQAAIEERNLVVLEDDKNLVPAQNIVPIIRQDALTSTIQETLNELSAALTEEALIELNRRVDSDLEDPDVVAQEWLVEQDLIEG